MQNFWDAWYANHLFLTGVVGVDQKVYVEKCIVLFCPYFDHPQVRWKIPHPARQSAMDRPGNLDP